MKFDVCPRWDISWWPHIIMDVIQYENMPNPIIREDI